MAETKIGSREFRTSALPAKEALALYIDLNRLAGHARERFPALMFQAVGDEEMMSQQTVSQLIIFAGIADILNVTPTADIISLLDRIMRAAQIRRPSGEYSECDFDGDFSGDHLKDVMPLIRWIIAEQYRDFFSASAGNGILGIVQAVFPAKK